MGIQSVISRWKGRSSPISFDAAISLLGPSLSSPSQHYSCHEQNHCQFHLGAKAERSKFHLSKLEFLSLPKNLGGWGLMDIRIFGRALLCKALWRGIFIPNPWSAIIRQKYLKGRSLEFWFRSGSLGIKQGSAIWLSFRRIEQYFLDNLKWRIFSGRKIFIGLDSFAGFKGNLQVPDPLLFHLHRSGLVISLGTELLKDGMAPILCSRMLRILVSLRLCFPYGITSNYPLIKQV